MEKELASTMGNEAGGAASSLTDFLPQITIIAAIAFILGIAAAVISIKIFKKEKLHISMEYSIMALSGIFVVCAVIFQSIGILESFSSAVTTVFTSIVFSWLLTKTSSKEEWQKQEQELARRSYRHIDYIESASKSAQQMINQYIQGDRKDEINDKERLIFSGVMDYIGYISGGINTCKMDWYDLMSPEEQEKFSSREPANQSVNTDDMIFFNQEDA